VKTIFLVECTFSGIFLFLYADDANFFGDDIHKGLSIKDVRSQGEEGFGQCRHFVDKGVLQMQTPALFGAKNIEFFKIYGVSTRTRRKGG